jgi:hypothetical protein
MANEQAHRLLVCKTHGVMWKMRPYDGPPEYDQELRELCDRHNAQVPDPQNCSALIYRTDEETAKKLDTETAVKGELAKNDVFIRDTRDELKVDALKCFNRHNRPKQGCIDWCAEDKTVGRKIGVPPEKRQYLCMYCPAAEYYTHRQRVEMGMYD